MFTRLFVLKCLTWWRLSICWGPCRLNVQLNTLNYTYFPRYWITTPSAFGLVPWNLDRPKGCATFALPSRSSRGCSTAACSPSGGRTETGPGRRRSPPAGPCRPRWTGRPSHTHTHTHTQPHTHTRVTPGDSAVSARRRGERRGARTSGRPGCM